MKSLPVSSHFVGDVAHQYDEDRTSKKWFHRDQAAIVSILSGCIRTKTKVLDVACGTNRISGIVTEFGGSYFGIDASPDMTAIARKKDSLANVQVADARKIPFKANAFDVIITVKFLKWIPDDVELTAVLCEISRVLRSGGIAVLHQRIRRIRKIPRSRHGFIQAFRGFAKRIWVSNEADSDANESESVAPKTRDIDENTFLKICDEFGLRFQHVVLSSSTDYIIKKSSFDAFYIFVKSL